MDAPQSRPIIYSRGREIPFAGSDRSDGAALMHSSSNKMFGLTHCQWLLRALWFKWANLKPLDSKSDANKIEGNVFKSGFDFICSSKSRETVALIGSNTL